MYASVFIRELTCSTFLVFGTPALRWKLVHAAGEADIWEPFFCHPGKTPFHSRRAVARHIPSSGEALGCIFQGIQNLSTSTGICRAAWDYLFVTTVGIMHMTGTTRYITIHAVPLWYEIEWFFVTHYARACSNWSSESEKELRPNVKVE